MYFINYCFKRLSFNSCLKFILESIKNDLFFFLKTI